MVKARTFAIRISILISIDKVSFVLYEYIFVFVLNGERCMSTKIYYFSGTGNSLHVAKELGNRIPGTELIPIVKALAEDRFEPIGQTTGFVFPLHFFTVPYPVELLLRKMELRSADYVFAIVTRGGSPCGVLSDFDRILGKKRRKLDSGFFVDLPANCQLHRFKEVTREMVNRQEFEFQKQLELITDTIVNKKRNQLEDPKQAPFFRRNVAIPAFRFLSLTYGRCALNKSFYADSKCIKCGQCEKLCPANKIRLEAMGPLWSKDRKCFFCFGCINYCPARAIQIKGFENKTTVLGRYHYPDIGPEEIAEQKYG